MASFGLNTPEENNRTSKELKSQLSIIKGSVSTMLASLRGSVFYLPLLTSLVGGGLILHAFTSAFSVMKMDLKFLLGGLVSFSSISCT
jgi:hypothetical protein